MTDQYTTLVNTPLGKKLAGSLGLPRPVPLRRWEPGQDPLPTPRVLLVEAGAGEGTGLSDRLLERGFDVRSRNEPGVPLGAVVLDLSSAREPRQLQDAVLEVGESLRSLAAQGRVVVIGRVPENDDAVQAATQSGVVGIMRSLAHEMRRGSTCNALILEPGTAPADPAVLGALSFLLSARSAYVSGQPLRVGPAVVPFFDEDRPLDGKVAVVTGAARGIGAAIARSLHRDGARLLLVDVPAAGESLGAVANEVGGVALQLDITQPDAGTRIAQAAQQHFGVLDLVVHNAGITRDKMLANMDESRWASVLAVNLEAQLAMNRQLLDSGALGARPHAVCLASTSGIAGNRGQTNYAASKAGIMGMVATLAPEFAAAGGTINAVAPGFIETEMTRAMPWGTREVARRLNSLQQGGKPEDVAQAVGFLGSDRAAGINGQTLRVCGQSMVGA